MLASPKLRIADKKHSKPNATRDRRAPHKQTRVIPTISCIPSPKGPERGLKPRIIRREASRKIATVHDVLGKETSVAIPYRLHSAIR